MKYEWPISMQIITTRPLHPCSVLTFIKHIIPFCIKHTIPFMLMGEQLCCIICMSRFLFNPKAFDFNRGHSFILTVYRWNPFCHIIFLLYAYKLLWAMNSGVVCRGDVALFKQKVHENGSHWCFWARAFRIVMWHYFSDCKCQKAPKI